MTDLRQAAEMALRQLQRDDVYLGHRSKTRADAIEALRQALDVDAVNMSQERVDETVKSEHEPVAYVTDSGKSAYILLGVDLEDDTPLYTAPPKREWVGLSDVDKVNLCGMILGGRFLECIDATEAKLKEKNGE